MSRFIDSLTSESNKTFTENGAVSNASTKSAILDFFSIGGALRNMGKSDSFEVFHKAWLENPLLTLKAMFYFRDIRGGQGQRCGFKDQLLYLAVHATETLRKNLHLVPEIGRWDDLYVLVDTPLESDVFTLFLNQLISDLQTDKPSLLAKWLKSENTSSKKSRQLATKTRKAFGMTGKEYRKTLSELRKKIDVVERKMSSNKWGDIKYEAVPSQAMFRFRKAFRRHDEERFLEYIDSVNQGKTKINSSAMYPYQIVGKLSSCPWNMTMVDDSTIKEMQAMWDNLPDYLEGKDDRAICVVDTSGSMSGDPLAVALSLGLYCAERLNGEFKDHFITFSTSPKLQRVSGNTLFEKISGMCRAEWEFNTNLEAVFDLILNRAIKFEMNQQELPDKLIIISDMEFDSASSGNADKTLMKVINDKFIKNGYIMPSLVFWNVNARNKQFPMSLDDRGFINVSGLSPSLFESVVGGEVTSPVDFMENVLNSERYSSLVL